MMKSVLCVVAIALFLAACGGGGEKREESWSQSGKMYEKVWSEIDKYYPYFAEKNIDWQAVQAQFGPAFDRDLNPEEFARELDKFLQVLDDESVFATAPDGQTRIRPAKYKINYPLEPAALYAPQGYTMLGKKVIRYGMVGKNIAYLRIDSLRKSEFEALHQLDLDTMFDSFKNCSGYIIDLRALDNGLMDLAKRMGGHFAAKELTFGFVKVRNGPAHDDFTPLEPLKLKADRSGKLDKPIVCLIGNRTMGAGEWLALMLRQNGAKLIGDRTRGAPGLPTVGTLTNGVRFSFSTWASFDADMKSIGYSGITPDIGIEAEQSLLGDKDLVLERAMQYVAKGK